MNTRSYFAEGMQLERGYERWPANAREAWRGGLGVRRVCIRRGGGDYEVMMANFALGRVTRHGEVGWTVYAYGSQRASISEPVVGEYRYLQEAISEFCRRTAEYNAAPLAPSLEPAK